MKHVFGASTYVKPPWKSQQFHMPKRKMQARIKRQDQRAKRNVEMSRLKAFRSLDIRVQVAILIALFVALSVFLHSQHVSADLFAVYLAAMNYGAGDLSSIYHNPNPAFSLSTPPGWPQQAVDLGVFGRQLYPFIYPPIWAALLAPLPHWISPQSFEMAAFVINPALMGICAVLAYRIMQPKMDLVLWMVLSLGFVVSTSFGHVALGQNQPQILVSTLILFALERSRYGKDIAAGSLLALAAAIKIYPAVFAIIWLATRNCRAFGTFCMVGGSLAGLSVFLTGWPLHQEFLDLIRTIANSFLTCPICWNVDATIAQWYLSDFLAESAARPDALEIEKIAFTVKPERIQILDKISFLTALALLFLAATRASDVRIYRAIWPAMMIAVAMFSPLTWSYHYLSVVFFLPIIAETYGSRGWAAFFALIAALNPWTAWLLFKVPSPYMVGQLVGTLCVILIFVLFLWNKDDSQATPP